MKATFFKTGAAFRSWLEKNHDKADELLVGFYKVGSGKASVTYQQALDEALAFGWIDGVRRTIDDASYSIRFTPRRARSIWSAVNIKRVKELQAAGRMAPPGLAAFAKRDESQAATYSYERAEARFSRESLAKFKAHPAAWKFFEAQAPYYKRLTTHRVESAKRPETRAKRLEELIAYSSKSQRIPLMPPSKKRSS
jgi:uncharacterized protein YdeI (YjbR/CyaY-like superfamily)